MLINAPTVEILSFLAPEEITAPCAQTCMSMDVFSRQMRNPETQEVARKGAQTIKENSQTDEAY